MPSVLDLARRYGVEMPIAEQVVAVCHDGRPRQRSLVELDAADPHDRVPHVSEGSADVVAGVTTGVTGRPWRGTVTPWGDIEPWDAAQAARALVRRPPTIDGTAPRSRPRYGRSGSTALRWSRPRLRIPDGDAVQRVWSVADDGGATVIEFENDSSRPIAIALTGDALLTERPVTETPVRGIELDAPAIVLPVGHRATTRVAIQHDPRPGRVALPASVPSIEAVVSGWLTVCERASRLGLPDQQLVDAVVSARCDLLLDGPVDPGAGDALGFVADVAQLVRLGEDGEAWLAEVIGPLERIARRPGRLVDEAFANVERLAVRAGDERAAGDIASLIARRRADGLAAPAAAIPLAERLEAAAAADAASRGLFVDAVERSLVSGGDVLSGGVPPNWLGANFEVHGLPTSARSTLSYAVRWHGERPALLWEQSGPAVVLTASGIDPTWSSSEPAGEVLLAAPRGVRPLTLDFPDSGGSGPGDSISFG